MDFSQASHSGHQPNKPSETSGGRGWEKGGDANSPTYMHDDGGLVGWLEYIYGHPTIIYIGVCVVVWVQCVLVCVLSCTLLKKIYHSLALLGTGPYISSRLFKSLHGFWSKLKLSRHTWHFGSSYQQPPASEVEKLKFWAIPVPKNQGPPLIPRMHSCVANLAITSSRSLHLSQPAQAIEHHAARPRRRAPRCCCCSCPPSPPWHYLRTSPSPACWKYRYIG